MEQPIVRDATSSRVSTDSGEASARLRTSFSTARNANSVVLDPTLQAKLANGLHAGNAYLISSSLPTNMSLGGRKSGSAYSFDIQRTMDGKEGYLRQDQNQVSSGIFGTASSRRSKEHSSFEGTVDGQHFRAIDSQPERIKHMRNVVGPVVRHQRAQSASNASPAILTPSLRLETVRSASNTGEASSATSMRENYGGLSTPLSQTTFPPKLEHRHTLQLPRLDPPSSNREPPRSAGGQFQDAYTTSSSPTQANRRASMGLTRRNTKALLAEPPPAELQNNPDTMRWTENVKQKRASRRKRRDEEEDDRVMVGTKVDQHHVNYVTAYNMLTGIRFTVSRTNAKLDRPLTDQDFTAKHKFSFDITGNELTPSAKYDFKFKDYAPWVFRHLRSTFGLDPADYLISLTSKYILSELGSPGKSGSFFYFSRDYKYIIKTIHHAEHKLLRTILKDYYAHILDNPNTLISQFYGLHRVKIPYGRKIHFVVMNNLFPPHRDIHQTYDLKGSTIGREYKEEDIKENPRATLKDLNWLRRQNHLEFGPARKHIFIEQIRKDVALLQKLKIMDYSLLVGIHDMAKGNNEKVRDKTLRVFEPGSERSDDPRGQLTREPSRMETVRNARELREIVQREKPIPMGRSTLPDIDLEDGRHGLFYKDDGGFQATHDDGTPGEEIYYLGVIDCLTHYGLVKRAEHFWKGLSHDKKQISPVPPFEYGERFINFMAGISMTREQAAGQSTPAAIAAHDRLEAHLAAEAPRKSESALDPHLPEKVVQEAEAQAQHKSHHSPDIPPNRIISTTDAENASRANTSAGPLTLPILEEKGESQERIPVLDGDTSPREREPQMNHENTTRFLTRDMYSARSETAPQIGGKLPPTPPREEFSRNGADTLAPQLGQIMLSESPQQMGILESVLQR